MTIRLSIEDHQLKPDDGLWRSNRLRPWKLCLQEILSGNTLA